jgi:hypothetical protein
LAAKTKIRSRGKMKNIRFDDGTEGSSVVFMKPVNNSRQKRLKENEHMREVMESEVRFPPKDAH